MYEVSWMLRDEDLSYVVDVLMPGYREKKKIVQVLREDPAFLESMLLDDRLVRHLMGRNESIVGVSPMLLFTVLLYRVRKDLESTAFTVEQTSRHQMVVFDTARVRELLGSPQMLTYLAALLASFVKINSFTVLTQVRKGVWHKLRFSDFDIDSMIRYSNLLDREQRYQPYRRIADTCLFMLGVFPDHASPREVPTEDGYYRRLRSRGKRDREDYEKQGRYFYRAAAGLSGGVSNPSQELLLSLAENFSLAAKPLSYLSDRYLGFHRDRLFLNL
ncbi:MAG: hypothetical protein ACOC8N_05200 [Spirochaetota bacterium]